MKSVRERGARGDAHRPPIRRDGGRARRSNATLGAGAALVVLMVSPFRATPAAVHSAGETPGQPDDSQAAACGNQVGRNVMALRGNTMRGLANQLGRLPIVGRPVIDATGLMDTFDIRLTWAFEPVATGDSAVPPAQPDAASIFTALREQLGLRLESSRGPVDVMVIDSVQPPSEN
jgi:uncharacterized protein (TIGR03435 family)